MCLGLCVHVPLRQNAATLGQGPPCRPRLYFRPRSPCFQLRGAPRGFGGRGGAPTGPSWPQCIPRVGPSFPVAGHRPYVIAWLQALLAWSVLVPGGPTHLRGPGTGLTLCPFRPSPPARQHFGSRGSVGGFGASVGSTGPPRWSQRRLLTTQLRGGGLSRLARSEAAATLVRAGVDHRHSFVACLWPSDCSILAVLWAPCSAEGSGSGQRCLPSWWLPTGWDGTSQPPWVRSDPVTASGHEI